MAGAFQGDYHIRYGAIFLQSRSAVDAKVRIRADLQLAVIDMKIHTDVRMGRKLASADRNAHTCQQNNDQHASHFHFATSRCCWRNNGASKESAINATCPLTIDFGDSNTCPPAFFTCFKTADISPTASTGTH